MLVALARVSEETPAALGRAILLGAGTQKPIPFDKGTKSSLRLNPYHPLQEVRTKGLSYAQSRSPAISESQIHKSHAGFPEQGSAGTNYMLLK